MSALQSRRGFVASVSAAAAAALVQSTPSLAEEGPPETKTLRLRSRANICLAPNYICGELLRAEGFDDVRYVKASSFDAFKHGDVDFDLDAAAALAMLMDGGEPAVALTGVHSGCYELFANDPIRKISDLKGKKVGIEDLGSASHAYLSVMAAHVGLDPHKDIDWVTSPDGNFMVLLAEGKVDAFLAFPPLPQELRARKVGRMILSLGQDKPWSQYFCCMVYGHQDFIRKYPVATKRYLRAVLKAADICANEPGRAAQLLVDGGYTERYDYAVQALADLPYGRWHEFDPEESLRFYALRLQEVGMIRSNPKKIIAEGTDWRFLNELKRELKT